MVNWAYVGWGGGIVLFAGLFDMMDGRVARVGKMSSTFGALYRSVLDPLQRARDIVRHLLLLDAARLFVGLHHYIHCADRFADGELRACVPKAWGWSVKSVSCSVPNALC